jgi:hypothetical protein
MNRPHKTWIRTQVAILSIGRRVRRGVGDRGEGVISTAIAVLIVAFIGGAMWIAFNAIWINAQGNIEREVGNIGGGAP